MAGDDVIELMIDDRAKRADLAAWLQGSEDWLEVVAAADRIAVQVDVSKMSLKDAKSRLQDAADQVIQVGRETIYKPLIIPVCYGGAFGPDLALISEQAGMSQNAIIDMHSKGSHVVDHIDPGTVQITKAGREPDMIN
ncbi:MAG: carboxyltransferase domain-containing protein, partial [Pseudomonadota bacterium]